MDDIGQSKIGSRWIVTRKERRDGMKGLIKARLVAKGFQEPIKPVSDSPTTTRDCQKLFLLLLPMKDGTFKQ